jgi:hypothetical protein
MDWNSTNGRLFTLFPERFPMRKILPLLGALLLCAAPAAAQQRTDAAAPSEPAPAQVSAQSAPAAAPALFPTTDQVREQVRASETARAERGSSAVTQRDWLYLVAAIVVGVIIAAVVLD